MPDSNFEVLGITPESFMERTNAYAVEANLPALTLHEAQAMMALLSGANWKFPTIPRDDVDGRQLRIGISTEQEHCLNKHLAMLIALNHLEEDAKYYDHLREMERKYFTGSWDAWPADQSRPGESHSPWDALPGRASTQDKSRPPWDALPGRAPTQDKPRPEESHSGGTYSRPEWGPVARWYHNLHAFEREMVFDHLGLDKAQISTAYEYLPPSYKYQIEGYHGKNITTPGESHVVMELLSRRHRNAADRRASLIGGDKSTYNVLFPDQPLTTDDPQIDYIVTLAESGDKQGVKQVVAEIIRMAGQDRYYFDEMARMIAFADELSRAGFPEDGAVLKSALQDTVAARKTIHATANQAMQSRYQSEAPIFPALKAARERVGRAIERGDQPPQSSYGVPRTRPRKGKAYRYMFYDQNGTMLDYVDSAAPDEVEVLARRLPASVRDDAVLARLYDQAGRLVQEYDLRRGEQAVDEDIDKKLDRMKKNYDAGVAMQYGRSESDSVYRWDTRDITMPESMLTRMPPGTEQKVQFHEDYWREQHSQPAQWYNALPSSEKSALFQAFGWDETYLATAWPSISQADQDLLEQYFYMVVEQNNRPMFDSNILPSYRVNLGNRRSFLRGDGRVAPEFRGASECRTSSCRAPPPTMLDWPIFKAAVVDYNGPEELNPKPYNFTVMFADRQGKYLGRQFMNENNDEQLTRAVKSYVAMTPAAVHFFVVDAQGDLVLHRGV